MALSKLNNLYQSIITDHAKHPHHYGLISNTQVIQLNNPTCGDVISLTIIFDDDKISEVSFTNDGCAISTASASMMTDIIIGKTKEEALALADMFSRMIQGKKEDDQTKLGDATAMVGVSQFPQRIKCATLAWNALKKAIQQEYP